MGWLNDWVSYLPTMLGGLKYSAFIAVVTIVVGYPIGLGLSMMVTSRHFAVRTIGLAIVEIGRGAPALVVLYLVYYGLPRFGITFGSVTAACVGLTFNSAAYSSEMMRGGIQAVPRGQLEAASALGLSQSSTFRRVILPQGLRSAIPGLMGLAIQMFQGTSLAYAIAVPELMKTAYNIGSQNFDYLKVFMLAGLVYAAVSMPATWITVYFERRMSRRYA
ncbi:amino acid ABC transporter permease [Dermatophilaceae bacterium Sec6.4]|nr:amino acid ABC transporter permease [Actinomycetota bacterium]